MTAIHIVIKEQDADASMGNGCSKKQGCGQTYFNCFFNPLVHDFMLIL